MTTQKSHLRELSRKDKKRYNMETKVSKIHHNFINDRDVHYKDRLTSLQLNLTTLHDGTNPLLLRGIRDLEEERDLDLVRLRFFEEYRVSRSSIEFQEDIERAKMDHEKLIKLCKEKLYSIIDNKIKNLKEERLLMDVANVHSYSMDYSRPYYHKNTRSHTTTGAASVQQQSGWESSSNDMANESATDTGLERRSLRRRLGTTRGGDDDGDTFIGGRGRKGKQQQQHFTTGNTGDNNNNTDESDFQTGYSTGTWTGTIAKQKTNSNNNTNGYKTGISSDSDFLQGISDHAELQALLFGGKSANGAAAKSTAENKRKYRSQRYSTKSAPPLGSLTTDEITEDINLLRSLSGKPPSPFKTANSSSAD
ncbi:Sds3p NDAI_0B03460 [Naumovozyma dairenensis CBS 421]|uniref:Transcriptional regulatory protein SDS3 n=1 Tax=Naumovozyma dairenensis (strain ATCC 10597 / BCRC 20456 / CBS 421 / NBRC 0211 / NRRL Y-12639) TaxID=1071378 RepID=G0W6G9_NAUDC|nr:hypothetical protein NDAI_0B03460 [Naumovozyma dairenensis CBS 421]CCD23380.1 hypothetical protein NDAI_0B03460 [Naumovozyma dairenensis CBS 421]